MSNSLSDYLQQVGGVMAFGLIFWMAYVAQPNRSPLSEDCGQAGGCERKLTGDNPGDNVKTEPAELPPRLSKWAKKAAESYARSQEKKWRNWEKAMFQPKP